MAARPAAPMVEPPAEAAPGSPDDTAAEPAIPRPPTPPVRIPLGSIAIGFVTGLFVALVALDADSPLRPLLLPYLALVPGLAVTRAAGIRTSIPALSLALVLSIGVDGGLATVLIATGRFEPLTFAIIVTALVLACVLADEGLRSRRQPSTIAPRPAWAGTGAPMQRDSAS